MLLMLILVTLSSAIILDYLYKRRRYQLSQNIPGPKVFPLIGSLLFLTQRNAEDAVKNIVEYMKYYGSVLRVWGGPLLLIVTSDPHDLEVIFSNPKHITKNILYKMMNPWLGDGLLLSSGKKWHQRRKIITPAFHFKILEGFTEIFDQQSAILVNKLRQLVGQGQFDIHPYITAAALDIVAESAMSTKINAQGNPSSSYVQAVTDVSEVLMTRMTFILYLLDFIFQIIAPSLARRQEKALKVLHEFTDSIIEERRHELLRKNTMDTNSNALDQDDLGIKRKTAFLDILLQSTIDGKPLSNADIREEVDTFMFEGHDTTTAGITFALYCISRHPDVQTKLFREIREVLGDNKDEPIDLRKLNDLKYLELVIKESLRLYPPVPIIGRRITEDSLINGKTYPAGSDVVIPIFQIHKNPQVFPNPEKFLPDRHTLENTESRLNPFVNVPFSAGPRNCIGQKFAMLELKSTISKILRHFELIPLGPNPKIVMNLILRSTNGVHLGLKDRVY